jgi:hypothetical protein
MAMGRLWRLSVVVIVLTLAPMQAWAECAWVLWVSSYAIKDGKPTDRMLEPSEGYTSKPECDGVRQRYVADEKERRAVDASERGYYTCLPDTIDPRGPKGGGR